MKRLLGAVAAGAMALTMSVSAHAELQVKDWKAAGDGLITFDTETGLEWLNLSQTLNNSINTITPLLQSEFAGFAVADKAQIDVMVNTVMPSIFTTEEYYLGRDGSDSNAASPIVDTAESAAFRTFFRDVNSYTYGAFSHDEDETGQYTAGLLGNNTWGNGQVAYYDLRMTDDHYAMGHFWGSGYNKHSGVYLVSQGGYSYSSLNDAEMQSIQANALANVPVPVGMGVMALALAGVTARRKV